MRKTFFKSAILMVTTCLCGLFIMESCNDDKNDPNDDLIVDWSPVEITIRVHDAEGNNLLDSTDATHYIADGATATFKGKTYDLGSLTAKENTNKCGFKDYMPIWEGFRIESRKVLDTEDQSEYMLVFGEIDGAADMHEKLTITWKDGSTDVITYHCSNHDNKTLSVYRWFSVEGEMSKYNQLSLVK